MLTRRAALEHADEPGEGEGCPVGSGVGVQVEGCYFSCPVGQVGPLATSRSPVYTMSTHPPAPLLIPSSDPEYLPDTCLLTHILSAGSRAIDLICLGQSQLALNVPGQLLIGPLFLEKLSQFGQ